MDNTLNDQQQATKKTSNCALFLLILVGIPSLSTAAILIKFSEQYIGPNATVLNRFFLATIMFGIWKVILKITAHSSENSSIPSPSSYTTFDILLLILSAFVTSISHISWVWSLTETSVSNANLLHNAVPIFATFGGWLFLGQRFDKKFLIGMFLSITGVIAIGVQDLQTSADQLFGDTLALLSAVFLGANFLVTEKLRDKFSAVDILLWSCFLRVLLLFPITLATEEKIYPSSLEEWLPVFCLALFCQVIGIGIISYCLKQFSSGFVSLFLLLEPLITTALAWLIFSEHLDVFDFLAFTLVLSGLYIIKSGQGAEKTIESTSIRQIYRAVKSSDNVD
jgi:drug/metabolite transporter (DMT)-like permease